jgi:hypothetical protein
MEEVRIINPFTNEVTIEYTNNDEMVYGVDSLGKYLGLVPKGTEYHNVLSAPIGDKFIWDFESSTWKYTETLQEIKASTLSDIDILAGVKRLKYITDVPGQQSVYLVKLEQAQNYLEDNSISAPYISIESEIMGVPMVVAAQQIVDKANLWNNVIGPQIEGIRRKNKLAVEAASTIEELNSIKANNIAELSVL